MRFILAIIAAIAPGAQAGVAQEAKPELPRVYLDTKYPAVTRKVRVPAGSSLQRALDAARSGDELVLEAGASYIGNFTWTRCLAGYVTVTGPKGPAEGVRVTPTIAAASRYPRLISPTVSPALLARNGGCRLRLSRLEITATAQSATAIHNDGLVTIGSGESTLDAQPSEITLDRVWIHGSPTTSTKNGAIFNGRSLALIDSWIDQIRWKGIESHCVVAWTGAGPLKLMNDHFDCASIGVLIGGAARAIADVAPSDIEVRGNHFVKDSAYKGYVAKNLFEVKDGQRVLLEGNVIERSWFEAQSAMAINLQSLTDEKNAAVQATDITVRWNRVTQAGQCITMSARGYNGVASPMARVQVEQNLCAEIGVDSMNRVLLLTADLQGVQLRHNTFIRRQTPRKGSVIYVQKGSGPPASRVDFVDNLIGPGLDYGCVFGEGKSGSDALAKYAKQWSFVGNGCWDSHPGAAAYPAGNSFVATQADVKFNADWSLSPQSPFKGKASDGKDPGVDIAELERRLAGVVVPR
ncbi:MAG TPA: hypothetical protein VFW03_04590 [Gemmatimonadaceae bacterium]|nr:hypothetical protein [Gemmatimonadaceae bacterium]